MDNEQTEERKGKNIFINILIIFVIVCFGCYLYASYIEPSKLIIKEYRIASQNIPLNFSGIKIIHFSDLYYGNTTHKENVDKMVKKINSLNPDLVLFTGNLISESNKMNEKEINEIISLLSKIKTNLGAYAVKGNIDYNNNFDTIMNSSGFKVLNNEYELIYNEGMIPIYLCGLSSSLKEKIDYSKVFEYLNTLVENPYNPTYKIVLSHEGDVTYEILKNNNTINLILSGNSLGGTIDFPYYGELFIPKGSKKIYKDYYKKENTSIYVSSGMGTDKYPYRLFNAPSFNLYRLKSL